MMSEHTQTAKLAASGPGIAVIAMAGRFPGAASPEALWENLLAGKQSIRRFAP
jgi:acyl transferase domain-containing protein